MKIFLGVLALLCAAGFASCGDKGSDAVGSWTLDRKASTDATREALKAQMPPGAPAEAARNGEEMARKIFESMTMTLSLKNDKTFSSKAEGDGRTKETTGTWSASGDKVTLTATMKDGQPVSGETAKPVTLTLKGDTLRGKPNPEMEIIVVLKRG